MKAPHSFKDVFDQADTILSYYMRKIIILFFSTLKLLGRKLTTHSGFQFKYK